ncbi:MAG: A/G-specific adenine glycosylase [Ruminococcaceae bacterium]|nr:A/G-specific adenine glycosylase [Oscillospiraceae bacterium]
MSIETYQKLPGALLAWYAAAHRDLPWRQDRDPYHIWISEIMLQQTRVEAVKGYYSRFLAALPTIADLANAADDQLQKLWEGLGYYSRVRNLKKAACVIMQEYQGVFPREYSQVIRLPGIGPYTAGAICSIAFNQPKAAVDGNVLRVITRLTDDATSIDQPSLRKQISEQLEKVYPSQAGMFTQALMELGATLCGPNKKPACESCPCKGFCLGFAHGTAAQLPVRKQKPVRRREEKTVFILSCQGCYGFCKREESGLLAGLWELPNVPGKLDIKDAISYVEEIGANPKQIFKTVERKHVFTHIEWDMRGVYVDVGEKIPALTWEPFETIKDNIALPTAFRQFL